MAHPLCGANVGTLLAAVSRAGAPSKSLEGAMIALAALARWPFSTAERVLIEPRLPAPDEMPAPVFILGHWRSGTTHLYNIMTKSGDWGYVPPVATGLPWDLFGLAKAFRPLLERALPEHRFIDNIPVRPDSPQEDEIAMANMTDLSFYHGIYFPRAFSSFLGRGLFFDDCAPAEIAAWRTRFQYLMRKLYLHQEKKPLLIKNPVYTGRLAMLREMYPDARFVHIHRNPYDVFLSMRNFYKKLLGQFALQDYAHVDIDETILSVYERMMIALERDAEGLSADSYIELRYNDLDRQPMQAVEQVYDALALPGFAKAKPAFEDYLASIASFEKNTFAYSDEAAAKVEDRLGYFVRKWGYERPGAPAKAEGERGDALVEGNA